MKYLSEAAYEYMNRIWGFSTSAEVDDLAMYWESDYPEMTCKRLVEAGAVEPNCKEAREMIRVAESIDAEAERVIYDEVIQDYSVVECTNCNHVHYIPKSSCDPADWINGRCDGCNKPGHMKEVA